MHEIQAALHFECNPAVVVLTYKIVRQVRVENGLWVSVSITVVRLTGTWAGLLLSLRSPLHPK
jgi:hypothetical protein